MNNQKNVKDSKLYKEGRVHVEMISTKDNKVPKKSHGKKSYVGKDTADFLVKSNRAKIIK